MNITGKLKARGGVDGDATIILTEGAFYDGGAYSNWNTYGLNGNKPGRLTGFDASKAWTGETSNILYRKN